MKNYFNSADRTRHICIMAMQETVRELSQSDTLTDEEKKQLNKSTLALQKFNALIYERFGEPYQRKIEKTMKANTLRLVGKYEVAQDCISHSASEDLAKGINELRMFNCMDCEKCDFKDCGTYATLIACDYDGEKTDSGCPFKL